MPCNPIKSFKLNFEERGGSETDFITKTPQIGILDFRAFLNLDMLIAESERAKENKNMYRKMSIFYTYQQEHVKKTTIFFTYVTSRLTATKYLDALCAEGYVQKEKAGRSNYYINKALFGILTKPLLDSNT